MLIVPLSMRTLSPADFGTLALITSFIAIANAILGLGLRQLLSIEYFHCSSKEKEHTLINEIIIIYSMCILPIIMLLLAMHHIIITYIFFSAISIWLYGAILAIIFVSFFVELLYQLMQYSQRAYDLTLLQITIALLTSSLTLIFLWYFNAGFTSIIWAQLIGTLCAFCYAVQFYIKHQINLFFAHTHIYKAVSYIRYGFPFVSGILLSWIISSSDRWILGYYGSMQEVGIYSIADMFAQVFNALVLQPWAGSYLPYMMNQYAENKNNIHLVEQKNKQIMLLSMLLGTIAIGIGCMIGIPICRSLFPPSYHSSLCYIWILLFGQLFLLGSYFCSCLIQFKKKRFFMAYSYGIPALLNVVLNIILIPHFKIYGAAVATLTSYFLFFIVTLLYNTYLEKKESKCLLP
jgi:O-antigen/teichoic acid export membrane protein